MSEGMCRRTVKTNIIIYPTDGRGRDGYITYNDAGFWKENIKPVVPKEKFKREPFRVFRSITRVPPSWIYHSDGTGRDGYILYNYGGLIKSHTSQANQNLQGFLRKYEEDNPRRRQYMRLYKLSNQEKMHLQEINRIQKGVINRLYEKYINKKKMEKGINFNDVNEENFKNNLSLSGELVPSRNSKMIKEKSTPDLMRKYNFNNEEEKIHKVVNYLNNKNNFKIHARSSSLPMIEKKRDSENFRYGCESPKVLNNERGFLSPQVKGRNLRSFDLIGDRNNNKKIKIRQPDYYMGPNIRSFDGEAAYC